MVRPIRREPGATTASARVTSRVGKRRRLDAGVGRFAGDADAGAVGQRLGDGAAGGGDDHGVAGAQRQVLEGRQEGMLAALDEAHGHVLERREHA